MDWNSYDYYGGQITEDEVKANADYLARRLLRHGWNTCVIDIAWHSNASMDDWGQEEMDEWGRLLPHHARFPSSVGGRGFKPLADWIHGLGLRFGIHIMPGITARAVALNTPVLGTNARAADVAVTDRGNPLSPGSIHFLDRRHPAARAYYDSLFRDCHCRGVVWVCALPEPEAQAIGMFNFDAGTPRVVSVPFTEAGLPRVCRVRDLWAREDLPPATDALEAEVPPHGARLFRICGLD
jgi:hypothetical protein